MSNTNKDMQEKVNGYVLVNPVKVARAKLIAKDADSLLVEYDRLMGLILDSTGDKVKFGTFCNTPKEDPVVEKVEEVAEMAEPKKRGKKSNKNA